jgi:MFS transporter, DHA2 family, multidrug resistance protein
VGYSLGLAASVLYLGAVGDRYGRKLMLLLGILLSVPACLLAAYAWDDWVLVVARILGGLSAGMAYPTTLALITALWSSPGRTKSIALWSALGGAIASLGPLVAGWLLEHFWWGSVFLITLPLAVVALLMAWVVLVAAHVNESSEPVDNLGGILSVVLVAGLVLSINFAPVPGKGSTRRRPWADRPRGGGGLRVAAAPCSQSPLRLEDRREAAFLVRCVCRDHRLRVADGCDVHQPAVPAERRGYDTVEAGAACLPAIIFMVLVAPRSAKLVELRGARATLLSGYVFLMLGFLPMLLLWEEDSGYWQIGIAYAFLGIGVGLAGTPASHSLTGLVPVHRAGMASGTADLQRDLGGAIMQSLFGALFTAGYASAFRARPLPTIPRVSRSHPT